MNRAADARSNPYLTVVATSRNDDHGGDVMRRTQIFVNALTEQAVRHRVPMELVLVEWNPPADRPPIEEALVWPADHGWCPVRVVTVSPDVHGTFPNSGKLHLFQMIAKNVGIRRARGEYVLATNIDLIFSDELMAGLSARRLTKGTVYRSIRVDVEADVPRDADIDEQLRYCRHHVLRIWRPLSMGGPLFLRTPRVRDASAPAVSSPPPGFWTALGALLSLPDVKDRYMSERQGFRAFSRSTGNVGWQTLKIAASLGRAGIVLEAQTVLYDIRLLGMRLVDEAARLGHDLRLALNRQADPFEYLSFLARVLRRFASRRGVAGFGFFRGRWWSWPADAMSVARRLSGLCVDFLALAPQRLGRVARALSRPRTAYASVRRRARVLRGSRFAHSGRAVIRAGLPLIARVSAGVWRVATRPYRSLRRRVQAKVDEFVTFMQGGADRIPYCDLGEVADVLRMRNPSARAEVEPLVRLNTLACGDFTLLDRDSWFRIGGNPEYPIYSFHLDSLMIYRAYAAGMRCVDLPATHVHYHIEHGSGYTPESNRNMYLTWQARGVPIMRYATLLSLGLDMLQKRPVPYSPQDWGLAGRALAERDVQRMPAGVPILNSRS